MLYVAARMLLDGTKGLAPSGATIVGQEFVRDPVALGQLAQSLLDVLPTTAHTPTEYACPRQTVRTNNAAVVAEGAAKPTSVYSVEQRLLVGAHLSEGIPRYWLLDPTALQQFIDSELRFGLGLAVELATSLCKTTSSQINLNLGVFEVSDEANPEGRIAAAAPR